MGDGNGGSTIMMGNGGSSAMDGGMVAAQLQWEWATAERSNTMEERNGGGTIAQAMAVATQWTPLGNMQGQ